VLAHKVFHEQRSAAQRNASRLGGHHRRRASRLSRILLTSDAHGFSVRQPRRSSEAYAITRSRYLSMQTPYNAALSSFQASFGEDPNYLGRAPGRVELLGNHTDYNGGLVLAAAIDRYTVVVGRPAGGRKARVCSTFADRSDRFEIDEIAQGSEGDWTRYVRGVVQVMGADRDGLASGFDAAIAGNVPIGAGLSSSASLEAAVAFFLVQAAVVRGGATLDDDARMALAKLLQRAENEFVGVASGLLDQFSVLFGRSGYALSLDCRTLEYERLPLGDPAPAIVVCDTKTSRRLADGMYNQRRAECESVVSYFQARKSAKTVRQLRDLSLEEVQSTWENLDPVGRRRARHVLTENERVRKGADALRAGDAVTLGQLISASHASSRDDFENSSPALDALIEVAEDAPGFLGGKLSGAGWAGCTVNLVEATKALAFAESLKWGYKVRTGIDPAVHICQAAEGATGEIIRGDDSPRRHGEHGEEKTENSM
jgi:galactokinase